MVLTGSVVVVLVGSTFGGLALFLTLLAGAFLPGVFAAFLAGAFLAGVVAGSGGAFCPVAVVTAGGDVLAGSGGAFLAGGFLAGGGAGSDDAAALVRLRGCRGVCSSPIRTRVVRVSPSHRARSAGKATKILLSPVEPGDQVHLAPISGPVSGRDTRFARPVAVPCILDRRWSVRAAVGGFA